MKNQMRRRLFDATVWTLGAAMIVALAVEAGAGEPPLATPDIAAWRAGSGADGGCGERRVRAPR
jgi:hypothetical protein